MSDVEMRLGQPTDAPAIRRLTHEAYAKWVYVLGREPLPMTADYEAAVRDHRFDLIFADGTLTALIETALKPDHLLIVNVAVAPAHQGRGHGRWLLAHAEAIAASHGHDLHQQASHREHHALPPPRLHRRSGGAIRHRHRGPHEQAAGLDVIANATAVIPDSRGI